MLIERRIQSGIAGGSITLLFRRWRRPQAVAGHVYRTSAGRIAVETVDVVEPRAISDADARRAGFRSTGDLVAGLRGAPGSPVYRLAIRPADGPDPRAVLAGTADLGEDDVREISRRLDRLDRSSAFGPWTATTLGAIDARPGVRAGDLATALGRPLLPFKADVRKLKSLGLTISLDVGYRLSPRGRAYLRLR